MTSPLKANGGDESVALVMDLHGYNLCAAESAQYSGWTRTAAEAGFIVVWPQGNVNANYSNDPSWDFGPCCASLGESPLVSEDTDSLSLPPPADLDDADFLRQVAANIVASAAMEGVTVDTNRLYFAGHSNGCMMAQAMDALQSDLVAAVCCHASGLLVEPSPDTYRPTSVQVVYGDLDTTLDFFFQAKDHILNTWGEINGCDTGREGDDNNTTTMYRPTTIVGDSGLYATHTLSNCSDNTVVQTVEVYNVCHFSYLGVAR